MDFERKNTKISLLEDYYSHFDEDSRLKGRHGMVEFITNLKYIREYLNGDSSLKIIDIGCGTGAYSIELFNDGYDITACDLVEYNLGILRKKEPRIKNYQVNALDLGMFDDNSFDVVILFGPIYHLLNDELKIKALLEAKRIIKNKGIVFISYYMNDYAILTYGFIKKNILKAKDEGRIDENYHIVNKEDDLFSMVRLEDINHYNELLGFERLKIIASDGASDYLRVSLNSLSEEEFKLYLDYHMKNCERTELLGASSHLMDIVRVIKE